jgi:hypothetical protein
MKVFWEVPRPRHAIFLTKQPKVKGGGRRAETRRRAGAFLEEPEPPRLETKV